MNRPQEEKLAPRGAGVPSRQGAAAAGSDAAPLGFREGRQRLTLAPLRYSASAIARRAKLVCKTRRCRIRLGEPAMIKTFLLAGALAFAVAVSSSSEGVNPNAPAAEAPPAEPATSNDHHCQKSEKHKEKHEKHKEKHKQRHEKDKNKHRERKPHEKGHKPHAQEHKPHAQQHNRSPAKSHPAHSNTTKYHSHQRQGVEKGNASGANGQPSNGAGSPTGANGQPSHGAGGPTNATSGATGGSHGKNCGQAVGNNAKPNCPPAH